MHDLEELSLDHKLAIQMARNRLAAEFGAQVSADTIHTVLDASWAHIDAGARIKHHVPLLAERFARGQLWAIARMKGHHEGVPAVLFLDTHDAGRAKMAKALLVRLLGRGVIAVSAGTQPDVEVSEHVIAAMRELDLHLEHSFPKPFTPDMIEAAELIVTFGAADVVAMPDGTRHEAWEVPDPRDLPIAEVRPIRDDLRQRVQELALRLH